MLVTLFCVIAYLVVALSSVSNILRQYYTNGMLIIGLSVFFSIKKITKVGVVTLKVYDYL